MNEENNEKELKYCKLCNNRINRNFSDDVPTKYSHLWYRFLFTLISWFALGQAKDIGKGFFVTLALFSGALFMEYKKFEPVETYRKIWLKISEIISIFFLFIGFLGLMNILEVVYEKNSLAISVSESFILSNSFHFLLEDIYLASALCVFVTLVDCIAYSGALEKEFEKQKGNRTSYDEEL